MERLQAAIIDDDAEILDLIEQILKEEGVEARRFSQAEDCLASLTATTFDIIISDLVLPGKSGLELLNEIKSGAKDIPFVLITGYASLDSAIEAVNKGAFYYIKKPFNIEEIRFVISRLKQRKATLREMDTLKSQVKILSAKLENNGGEPEVPKAPVSPLNLIQQSTDVNKALTAIDYLGRLKSDGFISEKEFGEYKGRILKRII